MKWLVLVVFAACAPSTLGPAGSTVTLRGRVSDTPMQAFVQGIPGKTEAFFDYEPGEKIVIYWVSAPACRGEIEITGTVKIESGRSKRQDAVEPMEQRVVDVHSARCVE
jgi:hypothetical protein